VSIALAIHGGAWNVPDGHVDASLQGMAAALAESWESLRDGATCVDVVELAVRLLEDNPTFNAGKGAHLSRANTVELDASIMEGTYLEAGAVAAVEGIRNPILLARRVMDESPHVLMVGDGARKFARQQGFGLCRTRSLLVGRELDRYERIRGGERALVENEFKAPESPDHFGTVGAVAVDRGGHVAAATSTGGTQDKEPGRVGDSAIIGAGTYADDKVGAVSATGWGEAILRVSLAKAAIDRMAAGSTPGRAGSAALARLGRVYGHAGLILVDRRGRASAVFNTPRMARGLATEKDGLRIGIDRALHRP
jgi:beta-aspartyl-peptidase (threonine type)